MSSVNQPVNMNAPLGPNGTIARRSWAWLALVFIVLGAIAWVLSSEVRYDNWAAHGVWCVFGLMAAFPTIMRALRGNFSMILTDHRLMFVGSFSLYFLFGAMLPWIGPQAQIDQALGFYPIDARDALRADAVNGLGFGLALLATSVSSGRWIEARAALIAEKTAWVTAYRAILLFLIVGTLASGYVLLYDLGYREGLVQGVIRSSGKLSIAAILLAAAHSGRGEFVLRSFAVVLAVALAFGGIVQFNKTETLLPLAALAGGLGWRYGTRLIMPIALVLLVTTYFFMGNIASYGRSAVYDRAVGLEERWQIVQQGWRETRNLSDEEEYGTWARLCYVGVQVAAMDFYDTGQGGDGLSLFGWVFVPRLLFPEKPEITRSSRELNVKITSYDTSSVAPGIFASGYYNGGWTGFVFASLLCGWILTQTSGVARGASTHRALVMLPFSLLGVYMALRIDGDFVADYVGSFVLILYPILFGALILAAAGRTRFGRKVLQHRGRPFQ